MRILASFLLAMVCSSLGTAAERPNIVLVLSDDHSWPHLGCYGDANLSTPRLDRLAAEGMRFNRMYTTAPQCSPSRASILTGRSPVAIHMTRFAAPLPREVPIFPELLRKEGYFTGLGGRYYHLDGPPPPVRPREVQEVIAKHGLESVAPRFDWVNNSGNRERAEEIFTEFLDRVPEGRPFFLQFSFSDPHHPYTADVSRDPATLRLPGTVPDTAAFRHELAQYYAEVERLDGDVGKLFDILVERGLAGSTLFAFMGDNGAAVLRGKNTLYELGLRVPFIVRWPGVVRPGAVSEALVSGEDLAPTFLAAAGIAPPPSMTGRSLLPLLEGEPHDPRAYVFGERGAQGAGLPDTFVSLDLARAVIGVRYKLIYNALPERLYSHGGAAWEELVALHELGKVPEPFDRIYFPERRPIFELYDLEKDPYELDNLAGREEMKTIEHELKTALNEWMIVERDFLPTPIPFDPKDRAVPAKPSDSE